MELVYKRTASFAFSRERQQFLLKLRILREFLLISCLDSLTSTHVYVCMHVYKYIVIRDIMNWNSIEWKIVSLLYFYSFQDNFILRIYLLVNYIMLLMYWSHLCSMHIIQSLYQYYRYNNNLNKFHLKIHKILSRISCMKDLVWKI